MANEFRGSNSQLHDHLLKQERLVFEATITANGTPADKGHAVDVPGAVYLRTEGKTAEADAVEDASSDYTTAADATGIFGILIDDSEVRKIYNVALSVDTGSIALGAQGASITSEGRIALDLDSNQDLSSQDITVTVEIDYLKKR